MGRFRGFDEWGLRGLGFRVWVYGYGLGLVCFGLWWLKGF